MPRAPHVLFTGLVLLGCSQDARPQGKSAPVPTRVATPADCGAIQAECDRITRRLLILDCDNATIDDPGCEAMRAKPAECEAKAREQRCKLARVSPAADRDAVIDANCTAIYVQLRAFERANIAVLDHAWRSTACHGRLGAVYDALTEPQRTAWASQWFQATGAYPWTLPPDADAAGVQRIMDAYGAWCSGAPCEILGRCVAARLPADHATHGNALTCVAHSADACRASQACAAEGRCDLDAATGTCVPATDDDCARSSMCAERKHCVRVAERRTKGPERWSCGGTTPATSGADVLGFVDNPALGPAIPLVALENVAGEPLADLSPRARANAVACMAELTTTAPSERTDRQLMQCIAGKQVGEYEARKRRGR